MSSAENIQLHLALNKPRIRLVTTELAYQVREPGPPLKGPEDSGRLLMDLIGDKDREHFVALHLNARNRVVAAETISIGSLVASIVHPREVFKAAILNNAAGIICGHNHPSGELEPSPEDRDINTRLRAAGRLLGIDVLDFLIVSTSKYLSIDTAP